MGGVWRTAKRRKHTCVGALRSKQGSYSSGGVWRTAKWDSTGYCSSPPSTSSSLHGLLSTSSSLHGLLFIQPPPRATPPATVQPPLHRPLFIQPSIVYCSSSPPHQGVLFIRNATAHCSSKPPRNTHCSSNRSASVSSSSKIIAPSGSVNSHRSIARVQ